MKHFFRGGIGLSKKWGHKSFIHQSERKLNVFRFLRYGRNDVKQGRCSEYKERLHTTFGLASPLLRSYKTDLPRIQHRFNTCASGILDENVMKRCSGGGENPKLVWSRYGSDQEKANLSSFVPTDYLPYNYDVSRREQENRKAGTKARIEKRIVENEGDADKTLRKSTDLAPTVYQLSSAQVLPWFCFCSTGLRSARDRSVMRLRPSSENYRSAIGGSSEKGRARLGLGRYQVGTSLVCLSPSARDFTAPEATDRQTIGKEKATDKQRTTEEQANKYQTKPKPSAEKEQRNSKETSIKLYSKEPSAVVAGSFGRPSGQSRTCLQACSNAVRQLFGFCSAVSRSAVEAESNTTRRSLEAIPNQSRSGAEGLPKTTRRAVEEESKNARSGCENITFQKGAQTRVELALTQPKTKVELGMNYQTTKDELTTSLARTNVELATTQEGTKDKTSTRQETPKHETRIRQENRNSTSKNIPERYCKGTGKVLNSGGKGTGEVLESYQRGTKEVLTGSRSVVGYDRDGGKLTRHCDRNEVERSNLGDRLPRLNVPRSDGKLIDDLRMNRLIIRCFSALCEEFRTKVESMIVGGKIKRQKGLKCVSGFGATKTKLESVGEGCFDCAQHDVLGGLKLSACLMIFCVLFSFPDLLGARAFAQTPHRDKRHVFTQAVAQEQSGSVLQGEVRSAADESIIEGATVTNDKKTVRTDAKGRFSVAVDKPHGVLIIKHIGYKEQSVAYDNTTTFLKIQLQGGSKEIDEVEVVSTGYQKIPKERATGSFVQIDNKLLNRRVSTNVLDRIEDVVPGLIFNRNNEPSAAGIASSGISIRGQSTIMGNTEPLIVVDNFPYEGNLNDINPDDVASITVLKDAAAAAIWGARAGNGVIVINTKRGQYSTPTKLSFSTNMTVGSKPDLFYQPQMSSKEFIEVERSLFKSYFYLWTEYSTSHEALSPAVELLISNRDGKLSDNLLEKQLDSLGQIDYREDVSNAYYRNSVNQQYALNLSGGTGPLKYVVSAGWDNNKHNLINTGYDRLTFSNRNTYRMWKDRIELATDIALSKTDDRPSIPLYTPQSNLPYYPYARLVDDNNEPLAVIKDRRWPFLEAAIARGLLDWKYRPLEEAKIYDNLNSTVQQRFNISARIKLMDFLQASLLYMYGHTSSRAANNHSGSSYLTRNLINSFTQIDPSGKLSYPIPIGDIVDRSDATSRAQNFRAQLDFNKRWNDRSDLSAIIGAELRDMNIESSTTRRYGYNADRATFSSVNYRMPYAQYWSTVGGTSLIPYVDYETGQTDRYRSFYTNFAYTYLEKYVLSGSARLDQSNIFGVKANQKGVPLYSAGVAWNIHQEDFMKFDLFNSLKLRSSFGYNGNVYRNVSAYTTARSENYYNSANNSGLPYATIINPPYPELRWERVRVLNLGFDFAILNNRILGSVDYFSKKGIDLIGTMEMDPTVGVHSFTGNNASTSTKGLDFTLGAKIIDQRLKWTSTLLGALVKDKVTSFSREFATNSYPSSVGLPLKGRPLFGMYSYEWAGLDPNDGSPKGYLNGEVSKDYYKMMYQKSPYSLVYSGSRRPTFFGSFRNDFSWNNLSLSINLAYRLGYYFRRNTVDYTTVLNAQGGHADYTNRWQKPGDELNTFVPSVPANTYDGSVTFYNNAVVHVRKGDHVRLQDINFSYRVLSSGKQKSIINNLDIIAYINNVGLVWTANKEGVDPDFQAGPMPRTYSLGLKIDL